MRVSRWALAGVLLITGGAGPVLAADQAVAPPRPALRVVSVERITLLNAPHWRAVL